MTFSPTWKSTTDLSFLCSGLARGGMNWIGSTGNPETSVYHRWAVPGKRFCHSKGRAVSHLRDLRDSAAILRERGEQGVHVRLRIVVMGGNAQPFRFGRDLDPARAQGRGGRGRIRH